MAAHNAPRLVGPSLSGSAHLNDNSYEVYSLAYDDYLARISAVQTSRTFVSPPHFPQSKTITNVSIQLHRRLYAMYSDVILGQAPGVATPGYCYLHLFSVSQSRDIAKSLGPFPRLGEVLKHAVDIERMKDKRILVQSDGIYHVSIGTAGIRLTDVYQTYVHGVDSKIHLNYDARVGASDGGIARYYAAVKNNAAGINVVHTVRDHTGMHFEAPIEARRGKNSVFAKELHKSGRWLTYVKIPRNVVIALSPGNCIMYQGLLVGSPSATVYFRNEHNTVIGVLSSPVVSLGAISAYLGPAVWSSGMSDHFQREKVHIEFELHKDKVTIHDYLTDPAMLNYLRSAALAISGVMPQPACTPELSDKVSITDPLDYDAPLQEWRYSSRANGPMSYVYAGKASPWDVHLLHTFRSTRPFDGSVGGNFCLSGFVTEHSGSMSHGERFRIAVMTSYWVSHKPSFSLAGCELSFRVSHCGDSETFNDDYHPDGSGPLLFDSNYDSDTLLPH